jgi:hypothetical protein
MDSFIGGYRGHVSARESGSENPGRERARSSQRERLIEYQVGVSAIFSSYSMGDQRDRTDAEHLHQRVHEKAGISGRRHARNCSIAEIRDEIQIDQLAEHDQDHAAEDRRSHA